MAPLLLDDPLLINNPFEEDYEDTGEPEFVPDDLWTQFAKKLQTLHAPPNAIQQLTPDTSPAVQEPNRTHENRFEPVSTYREFDQYIDYDQVGPVSSPALSSHTPTCSPGISHVNVPLVGFEPEGEDLAPYGTGYDRDYDRGYDRDFDGGYEEPIGYDGGSVVYQCPSFYQNPEIDFSEYLSYRRISLEIPAVPGPHIIRGDAELSCKPFKPSYAQANKGGSFHFFNCRKKGAWRRGKMKKFDLTMIHHSGRS